MRRSAHRAFRPEREALSGFALRTTVMARRTTKVRAPSPAIDFAASVGAKVINMSLGANTGSCPSSTQSAIDIACSSGAVIVAAAGNGGSAVVSYPAGCNHVIGVGATDSSDTIASFSQHNASVELSAPGVGIMSTYRDTMGNHWYRLANGTLMAAPHVAGCVALMRSINPSLTPDSVETTLRNTALDLGAAGRDNFYGYGRLDCGAAVQAAIFIFGDVPDSNIFHDDISAIAKAGVTTGCTTGLFCPSANVSREAMAAFMHRGFGRVHLQGLPPAIPPTSETASSPWTTVITPGLPSNALAGATGFIQTDATITIVLTDATGCPCRYRGALFLTGSGYLTPFYTDVTLSTVGQAKVLAMTGATGVTISGPKTVQIRLFQSTGSGAANAYGNATTTYYPFGGTGTNALEESAPSTTPNATPRR